MNEQQQHLKAVTEQQTALLDEIQKLTTEFNAKREMAIKLQGIIEYLNSIGVTLPKEESKEDSETELEEEIN
jgi:hypothetical protein